MKTMKKFFHNKGKLSLMSNRTQSDAVPEEQRSIPRYVPKGSELYNNFKADDCLERKPNGTNLTVERVQPETPHETSDVNGYRENQSELNGRVERLESVEEIRNCTESDLVQQSSALRPVKRMPAVCVTPEPVTGLNPKALDAVADLCNNTADSINGVTNSLELKELNQLAHELSQDLAPKKLCDDKKTGGNTYVITISNSTHFHIGSQKTINYPDEPKLNKKTESLLSEISYSKSLTLNGSHLLDIEDKLSDDDLLQISLSVRDKWRDFAKSLGVDDDTIHDLEEANDKDYNLIVYDVLKQYLSRYPNTTVGYMISLLKKNNEIGAIEKLMDKR